MVNIPLKKYRMTRWFRGVLILTIRFSVVPNTWASPPASSGNGLLFLLVFTAALITGLLVFLLWQIIRAGNGRLSTEHGSIQKLSLLVILAGCFIILVSALAWLARDRIKVKTQSDVGNALQIVSQTTRESLQVWVESKKFNLIRLARDPRLISLTEQQLHVPRNKIDLFESDASRDLRVFFRLHMLLSGMVRCLPKVVLRKNCVKSGWPLISISMGF